MRAWEAEYEEDPHDDDDGTQPAADVEDGLPAQFVRNEGAEREGDDDAGLAA